MHFLAQETFNIEDPRWRELVRILAELCPSPSEALELAGKKSRDLTAGMTSTSSWAELLSLLALEGNTRKVVEAAARKFGHDPRSAYLRDLLNDVREASTIGHYIEDSDDQVGELEALLFLDDLTMPTGQIPQLIHTLQKLLAICPAVCLLRVNTSLGSLYGTGFRITPDLILTNNHVLAPSGLIVMEVIADFKFEVDDLGKSTQVTSLRGDISTVVGEQDDDWAVIKITGMQETEIPIVDLRQLPVPRTGEAAFIIQHPEGKHKRLGFVRNIISDVDDARVKYLTDTQKGSSGAPVFDASGRLIALHFGGGRPTDRLGSIPVVKNRGVRISRVVTRMKALSLFQ